MEMKHFSHDHPLKLWVKNADYNIRFGCCDTYYSILDDNQVYGCEECNYFIHQACSEIPYEIHHFYHPDHLLKLCVQKAHKKKYCVACYTSGYNSTFIYRCVECPDFIMDTDCALLPSKLGQNSSKSIHYPYHGHPLTLHGRTDDDRHDYCFVCGTPCLVGSVYRCDQCYTEYSYINYHESCTEIDIPQEIQHYFHSHPLRLTNQCKWWSDCLACQECLRSCSAFECLHCASYMHIHCALLPDKLKQDGHVNHIHDFSHGHPLSLCEPGEEICKACKQSCADPTYGCEICKFFIHGSCTGLPRQITHPLHLSHSLTLTFIPKKGDFDPDISCNGCGTPVNDFLAYKCGECDFLLDVNCGGLNPTIISEEHDHLITLTTRKINSFRDCIVCSAPILDGSVYFTCRGVHDYGSYNVHLLCGPLPCTIKDNCHVDPLKLMDAFVEDYNETDEVYCDTCEQLRDPNEPVYYCKECNFITEIKCVMPEVLRSLEGHHGNLKLRTANKTKIWYNGMVFSFKCANIVEEDNIDIQTEANIKYIQEKYSEVKLDVTYEGLDFFTIEESVQILKIFQQAGVLYSPTETISKTRIANTRENINFSWSKLISDVKSQGLKSSSSYATGEAHNGSDIVSGVPSYSNEDLTSLMEKLDSFYGDLDFLRTLDVGAKIVRIGELMVMQELASYLKGLLDAHGDFTVNSSLEPRLKMFFLNCLCSGIRSMCITNVREVDEIMLRRWWKLLKIVKHAGFEIQFVIDHLSKVALAFFGRQVIASFAETKCQIDRTIDELQELKAKLDVKEREIEPLRLNLVLQKKAMEYERTPEMKECLEYESKFRWKKVRIRFDNFQTPSWVSVRLTASCKTTISNLFDDFPTLK